MKDKKERENLIDKYHLLSEVVPGSAACGLVRYEWSAVIFNTPITGGRQYVGQDGAFGAGLKFVATLEAQHED